MQKDKLTLENIKHDLQISASVNLSKKAGWRIEYVPILLLSSTLFVFALKLIWIGMIPLLVAAYFTLRFCIELKKFNKRKKELLTSIDRSDVSISVEKLSHFSIESKYESHFGSKDHIREEYWLYFMSGVSWRIPSVLLYDWSKDYRLSPGGMKNIAVEGNEYYYVTLQGHYNISFVYPCDFFELDEKLKSRE